MAAIEIQSASKVFPDGSSAVAGVCLSVGDGERLAILGPSGSGKSTLLRMIAGLEAMTSGTIAIAGRDLAGVSPSERDVAMVFQNQVPYPHLDVRQNLAFGLRARRVAASEIRDRVGEMAELLGLSRLLARRPEALSGGEKQRVALGRALVRRPAALLLDEPFSSLDTPLRAALRETLAAIQERFSTTTLMVTHDQAEAQALGHRVAVMNRGQLVQVGTPRTLHDRPGTEFVAGFVGDPPMNLLPAGRDPTATETVAAVGWTWPPPSDPPLHVGFRPEAARISAPEAPHLRLRGRVVRSEPKGSDQILLIAVADQILRARISGDRPPPPDAMLSLHVPADALSWFNAATGDRVELDSRRG